jgi:hypothetical protein
MNIRLHATDAVIFEAEAVDWYEFNVRGLTAGSVTFALNRELCLSRGTVGR